LSGPDSGAERLDTWTLRAGVSNEQPPAIVPGGRCTPGRSRWRSSSLRAHREVGGRHDPPKGLSRLAGDRLRFTVGFQRGVRAVQRIDPETHKVIAEVKVNKPCAAMAAGYGSLWVASRKDQAIVRIDPRTNTVAAAIPVTVADAEASIAAGEGGVWVLTD